ncbi:orotidine-5'-phosphate decarboxylase [Glaciecola sp. MH2013]|uniref:orotidine-5'-phosphate decarboxylase n=1 Tax=Glaciecola sp. MH2013 TaxID=2785524 RepID=UPI00189E2C5C|nr:orotidine-5'-phosphate decarboxylase [Glaciecola sp. MH2013]MBF7072856.1 orotidine-5'-phosphate decarboxylase [Glaciecola sp. MH2013]
MQIKDPKVIIALDYDNLESANQFVHQLNPKHCRLKVGKEMFTLFGPDWVRELVSAGFDVFLDLKFHDIPNTVAKACKAAASLGVWMVNVHASGGEKMMTAARNAIDQVEGRKPLLTAVTVLTSMDQVQFDDIIDGITIESQVKKLALLANKCKLDGVVCSAQEAALLRSVVDASFSLVTPGIRPAGSSAGDQKRVATPISALDSGVSYLVIGRPITEANNPVKALNDINQSIKEYLL